MRLIGWRHPEIPDRYYKNHKLTRAEPFISPHLNCQSIISDPETGARKSVFTKKHTFKYDNIKSLKDIFEYGLRKSRQKPCVGKRSAVSESYTWMTYEEVDQQIRAFGSALRKVVGYNSESENFVGVCGPNSPEWVVTMHGCAAYGYTIIPLYITLGNDAIKHIFTQTNLKTLVCMSVDQVNRIVGSSSSSLKQIIVLCSDQGLGELKARFSPNVDILSFEELLKIGEHNLQPKMDVAPTDLLLISYTSGSTGLPKGVLVVHEQLLDAIFAAIETYDSKVWCEHSVHLSVLPLAHVMEQLILNVMLLHGGRTGFLTKGFETFTADAETIKPTTMILVPRIVNRVFEKYKKAIDGSALGSYLYKRVMKKKMAEQKRGRLNHNSLADTLCFKKVRQLLGGNVCFLIVGSAPLSVEVLHFFRALLNGLTSEGYGSTETMGVISLALIGEHRSGIAGAIAYGIEVKLTDVPDLNIIVSRDHRGEICVKGSRCTKGYYKDPVKTAELIDEDGWLHTGDVGEWTKEGSLKIVDRVKSIFKLAQGEYIAPERIEIVYKHCSLVDQIFVEGNSHQSFIVAVVVPNFEELRQSLKLLKPDSNGDNDSNGAYIPDYSKLSDRNLCQRPEVRRFMLDCMTQIASEHGLMGFEKVKAIHLTDEQFSTDNGILTSTMKLARPKARQYFAAVVSALYAEV